MAGVTATPYASIADDELVIETPERVELYYTRAQIGNRFLAALIDHTIQLILIFAIGIALAVMGVNFTNWWNALGNWAIALALVLVFVIFSGYFVFFETIWNGQTPGKRLFRLRVIREDGRPIRFYEAMVRNLLRIGLDAMPVLAVVPIYSVGIVAVFFSSRSKRLGDYVADTVVIRESERRAPTLDDVLTLARETPSVAAVTADAPFDIDPSKLTSEDLSALRAFLRRRYDLSPEARRDLGYRIVVSLASRLAIPPIQLPQEAVLEEIDRQVRVKTLYAD
jgi:uncharacterized RDD family membrane protein YckC